MGYVRTKDGIYEECEFLNPLNVRCECSDAIEELCDAVVSMREGKTPLVLNVVTGGRFDRTAYETIMRENVGRLVLGIYTDKGLIYVAEYDPVGKRWILL